MDNYLSLMIRVNKSIISESIGRPQSFVSSVNRKILFENPTNEFSSVKYTRSFDIEKFQSIEKFDNCWFNRKINRWKVLIDGLWLLWQVIEKTRADT